MKGILINSAEQTISFVEVAKDENGSSLQSMYNLIGCECVTCFGIDFNHDVWVDDEGLLNLNPITSKFFLYKGYPQPIAGNGLILGVDREGDTCDTTLTLSEIAEKITFMDLRGAQKFARDMAV